MLVKRRMSTPVITVEPDMSVPDCLKLMQREKIRRTPVVENGRLVGIVSDKDLLNASLRRHQPEHVGDQLPGQPDQSERCDE